MATGTANPSSAAGAGTSLVPQDVFTGQDFYVPAFSILIGGSKTIVQDVQSISYTDSLTDVDSFDLTVNNWDPDKASGNHTALLTSPFKYSDADTFNPWQPIDLWLGYIRNGIDERQKMLTGEISTMSPTFPASGGSTLSIRALNLLHRFRTKQQSTPFFNRKDSEIAQMVVKGIASEIRKTMPQVTLQLDSQEIENNLQNEDVVKYVVMQNQYPIQFLLERSRDIGYELFVEEVASPAGSKSRLVTLHYRPTAASKQVVYQLAWGKSLISFQPTLQTANQVSSVTIRGWDPAGKTKIEKTVQRSEVQGVVQPTSLDLDETGLSQKLEITVDHPIQNLAEARVLGEQTMLRLAQGIVVAKGKTIGVPNLRAGTKVNITGLGTRFSGIYLVTTTTHTMGDGGYTTDFSARMEAKLNPA
jgi:phage protein D